MEQKQFLWVERYRPQTIDECVLPEDLKETLIEVQEVSESFMREAGNESEQVNAELTKVRAEMERMMVAEEVVQVVL